ncbi:MAG: hypothetical protein P9M14_02995 [Candidatus Alcyoniella australis]|nr:hypothetical protein [Candidatus Alcyoniella australis]
MRQFLSILTALAFLAMASPAAAQVSQLFEEFGVSPRDSAMGGAYTAVGGDYAAAFYNPAGLFLIEGSHAHLGYRVVDPVLFMRFKGHSVPMNLADYPSTEVFLLGLSTDFKLSGAFNNAITDRVNFGMAFGVGEYLKSYTGYVDPYTPYLFRYYERMVSLLSLYLGFSIKLTDWLAVGAGFVPAPSDAMARAMVRSDIYLPTMTMKTTQAQITRAFSKVEPLAGIFLKWPGNAWRDRLALGIAWRDQVETNDGKGEAVTKMVIHFPDGSTYTGLDTVTVPIIQLTGFSPMQASAGLMIKPLPAMTVSIDEVWKNWREWINYFEMRPAPRLHDTWTTKAGIEHVFSFDQDWFQTVSVRGGYYYEPSPVPAQDGPWNLLDNDKHVGSLGLGVRVSNLLGVIVVPVQMNFSYQEHILVQKHLSNNRDPQFGPIDYGGHLWSFAGTLEISF